MSAPTLMEWLRRPARGQLRQVAVAPAPVTTNPVLVTPHGFRIEGLDLVGLVMVLRDLA